jgi:hypothetical protein
MSNPAGIKLAKEILAEPSNPPILSASTTGEELRQVLLEDLHQRSTAPSPTITEGLHPGYPY